MRKLKYIVFLSSAIPLLILGFVIKRIYSGDESIWSAPSSDVRALPDIRSHGIAALDNQDTVESRPSKLVILTYMRCGSSFTGDLLQHHKKTFYGYEPLWALERNYNKPEGSTLKYLTGDMKQISGGDDEFSHSPFTMPTLNGYLNCRFEDLDIDSLTQPHMKNSLDTLEYYKCTRRLTPASQMKDLAACLPLMSQSCQASTIRAAKTIRLSMQQAGFLLNSDPNVKILHLIRDPRGMLLSQKRVGDLDWKDLEPQALVRCHRIMNDIDASIPLNLRFPNRILNVRYEDIAEKPVETTERMYAWLGLDMTDTLREYIMNITHGDTDGCAICTTRKNATVTAYKWKQVLDWRSVDIVQRQCAELMRVMGFRSYHSMEEMKAIPVPKMKEYGNHLFQMHDVG